MNKICTSIRQSQKLMKLGIDVSTADMCWQNNEFPIGFNDDEAVPAWSLSALLDVLPYQQLSKDKLGSGKEGWMVSAYPDNCRYDSCWHDNPIDACYELILKLNELKLL